MVRDVTGEILAKISDMNEKLSEGSSRFQQHENDIESIRSIALGVKAKADDQSDKVRAIEQERSIEKAVAANDAERNKPRRTIVENVLSTAITAIILGVAAVGYNAWRDSALAEREKERAQSAPAAVAAPTGPTAPPRSNPPSSAPASATPP